MAIFRELCVSTERVLGIDSLEDHKGFVICSMQIEDLPIDHVNYGLLELSLLLFLHVGRSCHEIYIMEDLLLAQLLQSIYAGLDNLRAK